MSTVAKNFRIDSELNDQANKLLEGLGLSMSQAVSMFLRQVVLHRGLPFKVEYPQYPKELIDAMEDKRLEADCEFIKEEEKRQQAIDSAELN